MQRRTRLLIFGLVGAIGLAEAGPAVPSELDWGKVPDQWRWVVHFDIDRIRDSKVAASAVSEVWKGHPERPKIEAIAALAGINLGKDLHGVTFVGTGFDPNSGAVIVHCKMNPELLIALISNEPTYKKVDREGMVLHQWVDRSDASAVTGCFLDQGHLVIGKDVRTVEAVIDRYRGDRPLPSAEFYTVRSGTYFQLHANTFKNLSVPFMSPLVRRSRRLTAMVGEQSGQVFVQASFEVEDADTALDLRDAIAGLVAIGKLHYADDPEKAAALALVRVFASENKATLVWAMPTEPALRLMREIISRIKTNGDRVGLQRGREIGEGGKTEF
ncbi:MAG: hypothetical protein ACUVTH_11780 [Thermogutta sp.]